MKSRSCGGAQALLLALACISTLAIGIWFFILPPPIVIHWQTETEVGSTAFYVLRSQVGGADYQPINTQPIAAKGSATTGAVYSITDRSTQRGQSYTYQLQEITSKGEQIAYPLRASAQAQRTWQDAITALLILTFIWGGWLFVYRRRSINRESISKQA